MPPGSQANVSTERTRGPRHRIRLETRPIRVDLGMLLPAAAVFASGFLSPEVGPGFAIADLFILAMIVLWLPTMAHGQPRRVLPAMVLPLILIFVGSLLGTVTVGFRSWVITDLIKDVGAFGSFLAMVTMLRRSGPSAQRAVGVSAALGTMIVSALLFTEPGRRAQAGFANPNLAAHFLGTNLIILTRSPIPRWLRMSAGLLCLGGLVAAGSFGALLMVVGSFAYLVFTLPRWRRPLITRGVLPLALIVAVVLGVTAEVPLATLSETGFTPEHLERSSGGRLERWSAALDVALTHPLGLGPGSNRGLGLLPTQQEAHNEYLAYLTERSVLGLTGLLLLYLTIWQLGRPGGVTRALTIGFILQSLVRETLHYRHLWLLLAFAIVLEERFQPDEDEPWAGRSIPAGP